MKLLTVCTAVINDVLGGDRGYGWKEELATFSQREKKDSLTHAWRHNKWAVGHVEKMTLHENQYSKKTTSNKKKSLFWHFPPPSTFLFFFQFPNLFTVSSPHSTYFTHLSLILQNHFVFPSLCVSPSNCAEYFKRSMAELRSLMVKLLNSSRNRFSAYLNLMQQYSTYQLSAPLNKHLNKIWVEGGKLFLKVWDQI